MKETTGTISRPVLTSITRNRLGRRLRHGDRVFWAVIAVFALIVAGILLAIVAVAWTGSSQARHAFGWHFITSTAWDPVHGRFGALPAIYGTVVSSLIALILAAPLGVMIGIFLCELCPPRLRLISSTLVELLAAIPSVVYGMWGIFVFAPFFRDHVATLIAGSIGQSIPLLAGPVTAGRGLAVAGFILAIMILPTIAAVSRDVLAAVPQHQPEALLALGATRWEMIRHALLPYARPALIGGVMLGLGRALGETMAATMVVGNTPEIHGSIFQPGTTAAALIASQLPTTNTELHASALVYLALILCLITLIANAFARLLVWRVASVGRTTA